MKHITATSKVRRAPLPACEEGGVPAIDIKELIDDLVCQLAPDKEKCL